MQDDQKKRASGVPDYGSSSGFSGDVPQSGMVTDEPARGGTAPQPPRGNGSENGSAPKQADVTMDDDPAKPEA